MSTGFDIEQRPLEDRLAIFRRVSGYGYAVDGPGAVGSLDAEDAFETVNELSAFNGRAAVAGITRPETQVSSVRGGWAQVFSVPHVVLGGNRASAICNTIIVRHREMGFYFFRTSGYRRLMHCRNPGGAWQIDRRRNLLLDGDSDASALLNRLDIGPGRPEAASEPE